MDKRTLKEQYEKDAGNSCWHWHGGAKVWYEGRIYYPHRLLWELVRKQPIPKGKSLIRTCWTPDCVNPEHRNLTDKDEPIKSMRWRKAMI